MTNEEMAESTLRLAAQILEEAGRHRKAGAWNLTIRRSQEVVELSLKGLLRFFGLEVPKVHDVGGFLKRHHNRLPQGFVDHLDNVMRISRTLREEREISFYGDEEAGFTPEELYTEGDAEQAFSEATFVHKICRRAIKMK